MFIRMRKARRVKCQGLRLANNQMQSSESSVYQVWWHP